MVNRHNGNLFPDISYQEFRLLLPFLSLHRKTPAIRYGADASRQQFLGLGRYYFYRVFECPLCLHGLGIGDLTKFGNDKKFMQINVRVLFYSYDGKPRH